MDRRSFLLNLGISGSAILASYWLTHRTHFSGGYYIQMGTSVTAGFAPTTSLTPTVVGDRLGIPALNVGFHGACAGMHKFPDLNPVSLYSLVDAIVSGDWSQQLALFKNEQRDIGLSRLMTANFKAGTYIGLEYGTNDFHYDRPIGSDNDFSKETFKGALNYSIQKFLTAYPSTRLFLIAPPWTLNQDNLDSDHNPNSIGVFLKEYVDAMIKISELNHIPCLDMWRLLGINKNNYLTFFPDGTHPNTEGARRRGEMIASFMNSVF
jgi:lysophospholipase L1-like esterase